MVNQNKPLHEINQKIRTCKGNYLLIADENWTLFDWSLLANSRSDGSLIISNRYDIYQKALKENLRCNFSDFDFRSLETNSFENIFFRISKEKLVNLHIIQESIRLLKDMGKLFLVGQKNEGIKNLSLKASQILKGQLDFKKNESIYTGEIEISKSNHLSQSVSGYFDLVPVTKVLEVELMSKPGIFGWDKIDKGSELLIQSVPAFLSHFEQQPKSLLDFGCGYGFLACHARQFNFIHVTATDNNAGALIAAEKNLTATQLDHHVIASNAGDSLSRKFDAIWANPPFHEGFSTSKKILIRFLESSSTLLKRNGAALFVVNYFIPIERIASSYFQKIKVLDKNKSYKIVMLTN